MYVLSTSLHWVWLTRSDATCLEGALKIKEVSYMHSEGVSRR
jgi:glucosamine 6-phosphate synthetase-like amidotransferase/phosphosugar isomerase protein